MTKTAAEIVDEVRNGTSEQVFGNISYFSAKVGKLTDVVKQEKPRLVVEVGLNAGHSAAIFLDNSHDVRLLSFDLAPRNYILTAAAALSQEFPNFSFHQGDSKLTLDKTLNELQVSDIDIAFVDGDHTYESVLSDVNCLKSRIRPGGLLIVDDTEMPVISKAVTDSGIESEGFVLECKVIAIRFTRNSFSDMCFYRRVS